ncbi:MAG: methyltransferase domain-containing protein [Actinomycetota bacterium]
MALYTSPRATKPASPELAAALESHSWYHTIDLPDDVVTPGYYDLRNVVEKFPWPDLTGKRCLDVGTFDGFLAFEMEKRGASEVVAIDVDNYADLDWPARTRAFAATQLEKEIGAERGRGFRIAKEARGSNVQRVPLNVYDLSPERVGTFDFVVCGSILTHLQNPIRALEAIRSVCSGQLLATEGIDLWLTIRHPRRPLLDLVGTQDQWYAPNAAGLKRLVDVAGFAIDDATRPYSIGMGPGFKENVGFRGLVRRIRNVGLRRASHNISRLFLQKLTTGRSGPPHIAILAHPEV